METVLCYLIKKDEVLMLYRNKKKIDVNKGKWIGVGGHIEDGEDPDSALIREVKEETNLDLISYIKRGIVDFYMTDGYFERTYVYISNDFIGTISECDEGILEYFPKDKIFDLNLWEGDRIFLDILFNTNDYFELELYYNNDKLIRSVRRIWHINNLLKKKKN